MSEWFTGLATAAGIAYLATGFVLGYVVRWVYCKATRTEYQVPWRYAGIAVGICAMAVVSLQSSQAYNTAKDTAQEVQDCQREFNAALKGRAKITSENDELSQTQRRIIFDWIHALIFPPEPYASMATNDPRRQDYGYTLTINTERQFQISLDRQDELQTQRDRNPLPDPTCGK